jgi:dTMP kinase
VVKGLFVVFEGIDGSGSSTQAALLANSLSLSGLNVHLTSEPTLGPIGALIRQIHHGRIVVSPDPRVVERLLAHLFAADRFDHLYNQRDGVISLLTRGYVVISTRYLLSSYAYHVENAEDHAFVDQLNSKFPNPDLTVYLDCPVTEAIHRIAASGRLPDLNETEARLEKVKENYERAFETRPTRLLRIDALYAMQQQLAQVETEVRRIMRMKNDADVDKNQQTR